MPIRQVRVQNQQEGFLLECNFTSRVDRWLFRKSGSWFLWGPYSGSGCFNPIVFDSRIEAESEKRRILKERVDWYDGAYT